MAGHPMPSVADHLLDVSDAEATVRDMATQALLNVGSRSFSHLLNAIERYLPLLRTLAGQGELAARSLIPPLTHSRG